MGTSVRSGTARALVVRTGEDTAFGEIADRLRLRPPETEFERGIRQYGYLLMRITLVLVLLVFAAQCPARAPADRIAALRARAGGRDLARAPARDHRGDARAGARDMAAHGVIVRRLNAIENFGSMDVLCTDKTGDAHAGGSGPRVGDRCRRARPRTRCCAPRG